MRNENMKTLLTQLVMSCILLRPLSFICRHRFLFSPNIFCVNQILTDFILCNIRIKGRKIHQNNINKIGVQFYTDAKYRFWHHKQEISTEIKDRNDLCIFISRNPFCLILYRGKVLDLYSGRYYIYIFSFLFDNQQ